MKRLSASRGFTLVELLTVIGIIAVLAGILIPTVNVALKKAKMAKAQADVQAIALAARAYYDEYGKWPEVGDPKSTNSNNWPGKESNKELNMFTDLDHAVQVNAYTMAALTALDRSHNPKGIEFLTVKQQSRKPVSMYLSNQSLRIPDSTERIDWFFADPWDRPYFIAMDLDYQYIRTTKTGHPVSPDLQSPPYHNTSGVDVYSIGPVGDDEIDAVLHDNPFDEAGTWEEAINNW